MADKGNFETAWCVKLASEAATRALAMEVRNFVGANDLVTLSGDIGAGKSTFARFLIRSILEEPGLEAPSPTFTIMQVYEGPDFPIVHADLYRIKDPDEIAELGWEEASEGALVLVEWIERAGDRIPPDRLDIHFRIVPELGEGVRLADITGHGAFQQRLRRARAIYSLLRSTGWAQARRIHMTGDASTRLYERLVKPEGSAVLMISSPRVDPPTLQYAVPYSTLVHLAEDIKPFIAIGNALCGMGYSAPKILGADINSGLAVLEDLGVEGVVDASGPIQERYLEAVALLADLHARDLPAAVPSPDGELYTIPSYDLRAYQTEAELLVDWFAIGTPASSYDAASRTAFADMWRRALMEIGEQRTWVLRDFHSPNIIWLPDRVGLNRVGLIDFQDCVIGHAAYDVVSLLQDARVTVPAELELRLLSHYARLRRKADPAFDMANFARAYAVLGAQRASKILGIFARLDKRDLKPQYLKHIPRVEKYLARNLTHPGLLELRTWFQTCVPHILNQPAT